MLLEAPYIFCMLLSAISTLFNYLHAIYLLLHLAHNSFIGLNCMYSGPSILRPTHGTKKMWSYIVGGLQMKVMCHRKLPFGTKSSGLIIKGGLKIEGCVK